MTPTAHLSNGIGHSKYAANGRTVSPWEQDIGTFREYLAANPSSYQSLLNEGKLPRSTQQDEKTPPNIPDRAPPINSVPGSCFLSLFKLILFTVWLVLPMLGLSASYCLKCIHDEFFSVIVERASRSDQDLFDEFTYYERFCNAYDLTANLETAHTLVLDKNASDPSAEGVDIMMKHGALVMPQVLSPRTIRDLRKFIQAKNDATRGTDAEFPVSQGYQRISYGIEATEDETVIRALREVYDDPRVGKVLAGLVGQSNPALTEITAITAAYGAEDQAWHPDVKPDGNGIQFGRTYSHSYSLFLPLQDTTREMGATHLCPGTHYCTDDDLSMVCQDHVIPVSHVTNDGDAWRAGDAVLLNQQVWHRGAGHTDPSSGERIVFIVSFIARPQSQDSRQLARGTYFHMKWNMWGHTWQDLSDSAVSMIWPFSVLRCLHLWKPSTRQWGYDLVTAVALRMANFQLGCEPEDLPQLAETMRRVGLPSWLAGTVDEENMNAWHDYISETAENILNFFIRANITLMIAYAACMMITSIFVQIFLGGGGFGILRASFIRVFWISLLVGSGTIYILDQVRTSDWGTNISSGFTLMRPFPKEEQNWRNDPEILALSEFTSTLPQHQDVLIGARLHTKNIGAYSLWLNYHPGNMGLRNLIDSPGGGNLYRSYRKGLPPTFSEEIESRIMGSVKGRLLKQNYQNGDWMELDDDAAAEYVQSVLSLGRTDSLLSKLSGNIHFLLDQYRFGVLRGTAMSRSSQSYLHWWGVQLDEKSPITPAAPSSSSSLPIPISYITATTKPVQRTVSVSNSNSSRWIRFPEDKPLTMDIGDPVWYIGPGDTAFPATIMSIHERRKNNRYDVAFDGDATYERGSTYSIQYQVPASLLVPVSPVRIGTRISALYEDSDEYFEGIVRRVRPNGAVDVAYDDGDFEVAVAASRYKVAKL